MKRAFGMAAFILLLLSSCGPTGEKAAGPENEALYSEGTIVDKAAASNEADEGYLNPFKKNGAGRFRIAVMQSGDYFSYTDVFEGILKGLMTIGWIRDIPPLGGGYTGYEAYEDGKTVLNIITELNKTAYSDYLELSPDLFFDLKWSDDNASSREFRRLTSTDGQVDLIISLGTQISAILAGREDLAIPVLVDSVSDPIGSEIIASIEDSGKDNLTAVVDPEQDLRQVKLFHSVIKFQKLGIIYEDSPIGRTYGAVEDVRAVAEEYGFEVVAETDVLPDPENEDDEDAYALAEQKYVEALEKLCPQVDAVYLAVQAGLSEYSLPAIVETLERRKKPSFIMEGKDFVRNGILLGESDSNLLAKGIYNARKIVNIFKGRKPRELNQKFEHVPHIAINLDAAQKIGYDVPIDIIASADEIFSSRRSADE